MVLHVELDFQRSCLGPFQAQCRQTLAFVGYQYPNLRGRDHGLAPVSAHVSQRNNRPRVAGVFVGDMSGDTGKDLRRQPIHWTQQVMKRGNQLQDIVCSRFETLDLKRLTEISPSLSCDEPMQICSPRVPARQLK